MKFVCERCHTRYSIADDKVRQKILKIRCKTCENVITVRDPGSAAAAAAEEAPAAAPAPPPPPRTGQGERAAAREWFVAINGDQVGPLSRSEAARRILSLKQEDEVYVWKDGLDGWKPPAEVAPIHQEMNTLRVRPAPPPPRLPVPPPKPASKLPPPRPSAASPAGRPGGKGGAAPRPSAGRGSMPATATLPDADAFTEEDHTQIQPFDAGMLAGEAMGRPASPGPAAVLAFMAPKPKKTEEQEAPPHPPAARAALDGLFSDLPPAHAGAAAFPHAPSGLSQLVSSRRSPVVKFVAAGAVMAVLIGLVVLVLGSRPSNESKAPAAPIATAPKPVVEDEAATRADAERKFQAIVAEPAPTVREVRRAARGAPPKPGHPGGPSVSPPALEPAPLSPDQATEAPHRVATGERRVPELRSARAPTSADSGPTESMISAVVKKNQSTIKTCYERALKRDDRLRSGRIDVSASVGSSGIVRSVSLTAPPEFVTVESCIKTAVRRWAFPSNSDEYKIEFPLILQGNL